MEQDNNFTEVREDSIAYEDYANAIGTLRWYGGFQLIIGTLIVIFAQDAEYKTLGIGAIISGAVLFGLGIWAQHTYSKVPLWIGFALCLLNIVFTLIGGKTGGIIISGFIAYRLYKGASAKLEAIETPKYDDTNILDSNL